MEFEGNIQDIGAESGPVQAFESFVPAALEGVDMGSFEPTESFEPAQPNPFKVTSAPSEALRTAQNQSESVAGVNTASGAAGPGGKSSEEKKADAREYHARLAQIILSSLPQGDTSHLPHHDDDITIKVGDKTITMAQGDLFQLARKNASNPDIPPAQQLMWARIARATNPELPADPDQVNKIVAENPQAVQTGLDELGSKEELTAKQRVESVQLNKRETNAGRTTSMDVREDTLSVAKFGNPSSIPEPTVAVAEADAQETDAGANNSQAVAAQSSDDDNASLFASDTPSPDSGGSLFASAEEQTSGAPTSLFATGPTPTTQGNSLFASAPVVGDSFKSAVENETPSGGLFAAAKPEKVAPAEETTIASAQGNNPLFGKNSVS